MILHTFGWVIVIDVKDLDNCKTIEVYPARVKFRGFSEETNSQGYINVSKYLNDNIAQLKQEAEMEA